MGFIPTEGLGCRVVPHFYRTIWAWFPASPTPINLNIVMSLVICNLWIISSLVDYFTRIIPSRRVWEPFRGRSVDLLLGREGFAITVKPRFTVPWFTFYRVPIYRVPIYRVPIYRAPIYISTCPDLPCPDFPGPSIYRAYTISPENKPNLWM